MSGDSFRFSGVPWAPVIPSHWGRATIGRVARVHAGGTPDRAVPEYWADGSVPWLNSGAVNDWIIRTPSEYVSEVAVQAGRTRWAEAGSVLVALAGQGRTKGLAARLEFRSTLNQSMSAIKPSRRLNYRYLHFWLSSNYERIRGLAGGDLRDGLNLQHVRGIRLPLPPVPEQAMIADYLDGETAEIDAFIVDQENLIALLEERRRAVADWILLGRRAGALRVYSGIKWIGEIPADWRVVPFGRLARESPETNDGNVVGSMLSVSSVRGVVPREYTDESQKRTVDELVNYRVVRKGQLVVNSMWLNHGGLGVSEYDGHVSPAYRSYDINQLVNKSFLHHLMRSKTYIDGYSALLVGIRPNSLQMTRSDLMQFPILIPPMQEQARIVEAVDESSKTVMEITRDAREAIALSHERRAALISAAVTGQIDVTAHKRVLV